MDGYLPTMESNLSISENYFPFLSSVRSSEEDFLSGGAGAEYVDAVGEGAGVEGCRAVSVSDTFENDASCKGVDGQA